MNAFYNFSTSRLRKAITLHKNLIPMVCPEKITPFAATQLTYEPMATIQAQNVDRLCGLVGCPTIELVRFPLLYATGRPLRRARQGYRISAATIAEDPFAIREMICTSCLLFSLVLWTNTGDLPDVPKCDMKRKCITGAWSDDLSVRRESD